MTKNEVRDMLGIIAELYPRYFKNPSPLTVEAWHRVLGDLDNDLALFALEKHTTTNTFPPSVAEIRAAAVHVTNAPMLTDGEAWDEVTTAMRQYGSYREADALTSMSITTRKCVQAITWRELCLTEDIMATRAHFFKIYNSVSRRVQEDLVLPIGLKNKIAAMLPVADDALSVSHEVLQITRAPKPFDITTAVSPDDGLTQLSSIKDILRRRV